MDRAVIRSICLTCAVLAMSSRGFAAISEDNFLARSTADLTTLCSVAPEDGFHTAAVNFCHGFVVGAYRVLAQEQEALGSGKVFCPPATLPSRNEAIATFIDWTKANPTLAALPPIDGMLKFLIAKFPCGTK